MLIFYPSPQERKRVDDIQGSRFTKTTILHVTQQLITELQFIACSLGTYHFGYKREI